VPQEQKAHRLERPQWEGRSFRFTRQTGLLEVIEAAFDYRGDVTLELKDGSRIEGYLFNRETRGAEPYIQLFPKDEPGTKAIQYADIVAVEFTGEDTAFGGSWEAWVSKSEVLRKADAERVRAEAEARGDL
jgi:transcriptional antiterminator Rof (Rho-off)